jgi:hypothetical protein
MTKKQLHDKIRNHISKVLLLKGFREGIVIFELDDSFQITAKVKFRFDIDYDYPGEIILSKRHLQLILTPSEYEQLIQSILDDIKG